MCPWVSPWTHTEVPLLWGIGCFAAVCGAGGEPRPREQIREVTQVTQEAARLLAEALGCGVGPGTLLHDFPGGPASWVPTRVTQTMR